MSDSPSARIVAAAAKTTSITDSIGRVLKVRKLDTLGKFDLSGAIGAEGVSNPVQFGMAVCAACVTDIDGVPVPFPTSLKQIRAALANLGEEGLTAVGTALAELSGVVEPAPADDA